MGATASGKSALAMAVAATDPTIEIVAVDSMQVYRGMDIGTAKPTAEERRAVRHHLLDVADPSEEYTVTRYQADSTAALVAIEARGHRALLVGGTGLYLQAVVDELEIPGRFPAVRAELEQDPDTEALHRRLAELDPIAAARMESTNRRRVLRALEVTMGAGRPFSSFGPGLDAYPPSPIAMVGLRLDPALTAERIAARVHQQMDDGFLDEVRTLAARPAGLARTARQALGYRELLAHLEAGLPLDDSIEQAIVNIRRYARRQRSWFGRDPRIIWLDHDGDPRRHLGRLVRDWVECA